MSAFAVIYERSNKLEDPGVINRVMERLSHRGPDGSNIISAGNVIMGHWHFWTTPEEVGERQPLGLNGQQFKIVLDGRIDNREELISKLDLSSVEGGLLSDAALIIHAYARWGGDCFKDFVGEFALVIFDEMRNEIICARDHLGDRTLFYSFQGNRAIIASEPWAVAGIYDSRPELNDTAVAHYFALKVPEDGQTFFNNIYELLPAHTMVINTGGPGIRRYWKPDPSKKIRYKTDKEYAEHFRNLLEESVRCRLRSNAPAGILMSGGLDSASVACLAARITVPQQLVTISYVFDELPDCDERQYINAVREKWNTRSIQIPSDDAWPYKNWRNWRRNPNRPEGNPYRLIKERAYHRAHEEGLRVLLTGVFGDHLYDGANEWMADLLAEGKILKAIRGLSDNIRRHGFRPALAAGSLRRVVRHVLDNLPGGRYLHGRRITPPWLTSFSLDRLNIKTNTWLEPAFKSRANLLGLRAAQDSTGEFFFVNQHAMELRHPFRDRRLIEFVAALPAYQLYAQGVYKYILRIAMKDILPEMIRTRLQPTFLASFLLRGVERENSLLQSYAQDPQAKWRKFVQAEWLSRQWKIPVTPENDGAHALIPWLCFSFEAW